VIEFVFMLTHHDRTVDDPAGVYQQVRGSGLRYVGFKDIGATVAQLRDVCDRAHADGLEVMLEDLAWWSAALENARAAGELVPGTFRARAALAAARS